ncbi:MAG: hypothetical protein ACFBRM_09865 [Pikeienuella sp.]
MPRLFVNSMSNFMIQGGVVSFTLQDQAISTQGGQAKPLPPEDVANIVMREQDFAQLVAFLNQHIAAFENQTGRSLGEPQAAGQGARPAQPGAKTSTSMKIRPRES